MKSFEPRLLLYLIPFILGVTLLILLFTVITGVPAGAWWLMFAVGSTPILLSSKGFTSHLIDVIKFQKSIVAESKELIIRTEGLDPNDSRIDIWAALYIYTKPVREVREKLETVYSHDTTNLPKLIITVKPGDKNGKIPHPNGGTCSGYQLGKYIQVADFADEILDGLCHHEIGHGIISLTNGPNDETAQHKIMEAAGI